MPDLESLSDTVEYVKQKLDKIAAVILGDPADESKPGFLIRLDRLERSYASHRRALALFGGALVTIMATVVAAFVMRVL